MHNNDSKTQKTANEERLATFETEYQDGAKLLDEVIAENQMAAELWGANKIDLGPLSDIDLGPLSDIDLGTALESDLSTLFGDKPLDLDLFLFGDPALAKLTEGRMHRGDHPNELTIAICDPSGTRPITIRISGDIIARFKREAPRRGTKYQTLMIETLRSESANW